MTRSTITHYTIKHYLNGSTPTEYTTTTERNIKIMIARCRKAGVAYTVTTSDGTIYAQG